MSRVLSFVCMFVPFRTLHAFLSAMRPILKRYAVLFVKLCSQCVAALFRPSLPWRGGCSIMPVHEWLYENICTCKWLYENICTCKWLYENTSRPCRTLFGYCPPPALGSRKADMKTLSFCFPTPYPCHVCATSYQAQTSWAAELPVPCTHFFLCPEHDNGWVRWRTLLIPTNTSK